jgi:hypothetical protein
MAKVATIPNESHHPLSHLLKKKDRTSISLAVADGQVPSNKLHVPYLSLTCVKKNPILSKVILIAIGTTTICREEKDRREILWCCDPSSFLPPKRSVDLETAVVFLSDLKSYRDQIATRNLRLHGKPQMSQHSEALR